MKIDVIQKLKNRKTSFDFTATSTDDMIILDEKKLKNLQSELLSIYQDILQMCQKYKITPFLVGGSALGAVRHQGFIPWDDDLDLGMTRRDYLIFRKYFRTELGEKYILNAPNYSRKPKARFPKVMKKGTICRSVDDYSSPKNCGVFVDIFIIENIPQNSVKRLVKGLFCNGLEFIAGQVAIMEHYDKNAKLRLDKEGKLVSLIRRTTGTVFGIVPSENWYNGIDKAVRYYKNSSYVGLPTGRKHYFGESLQREVCFPPRFMIFCGIQVPVFNKVEKYLVNLYGDDYMELPPVDKRENHMYIELDF